MLIRLLTATVLCAFLWSPVFGQFASEQDRRDALQHYRTGQELMSAEQFEKAAHAFQRAIEKDTLLTLAHYGLGQANMALRRFASAIIAFRNCRGAFRELHRLREVDRFAVERQRDEEIRELRDSIRRIRQGNIKAGQPNLMVDRLENRIQELERQRTSNTGGFISPPEVSLALGSAYFRNGDLDDAAREWKAAVEVHSKMGEAHNNLAVLYMMRGEKKEAEDSVRAAEKAGFRVNPNLKADIRKMTS